MGPWTRLGTRCAERVPHVTMNPVVKALKRPRHDLRPSELRGISASAIIDSIRIIAL